MDSRHDHFEDGETLIRRIPPSTESLRTTCDRKDGGLRATSAVMSTREDKDEDHLSCSRLQITSPQRLLDDLQYDNIDSAGWHVCRFLVSDVKDVGLEIAFTPTERDPGHCSITAKNGLAYPNNKAQKLARRTRILTEVEINALSDV